MAGSPTSGGGRGRQTITGINITPMVDVVLVLLVIMMVSAKYVVAQSIKVDLPNTQTSDGSASAPASVTIGRDGALFFNAEPTTEALLPAKLKELVAKSKSVSLIVSADKEASHGKVVNIIDLARTAGITQFAVNVERRN